MSFGDAKGASWMALAADTRYPSGEGARVGASETGEVPKTSLPPSKYRGTKETFKHSAHGATYEYEMSFPSLPDESTTLNPCGSSKTRCVCVSSHSTRAELSEW